MDTQVWSPATHSAALQDNNSAITTFVHRVLNEGKQLYRDLAWRNTRDPYAIWLSEVMLQQTQVSRVEGRWQRWLDRFPTAELLSNAPTAQVLQEWQGLGYNRRALALQKAAQQICTHHHGELPTTEKELVALPGIGPTTAAGIQAFAYEQQVLYLETNVRAVLLHELFPQAHNVPDKTLLQELAACLPQPNIRAWYYALLDYGAYLKKTVPNPSRRSAQHTKQSAFENSWRQKRAMLLRALLEADNLGIDLSTEMALEMLNTALKERGHNTVSLSTALALLEELSKEGFCRKRPKDFFDVDVSEDDPSAVLWSCVL